MKQWIAPLIIAALAVVLPMMPGCRSLTRSLFNTDLEGEVAPALTSTEWVLAAGESAPTKDQWRMLVFFKPG